MQTAVRKSSRRRVDDARARPHVVLEARRDAAPPVHLHHRHRDQEVAVDDGVGRNVDLLLAEGAHPVGAARHVHPAELARWVAHGVISQIDVVELLAGETGAGFLEHVPERPLESRELVPRVSERVHMDAVLQHHVIGRGVAHAAVSASLGHRDAGGPRLSSYVLEHGLGHAHIDGVANQEGIPRRQAPDVGLDDHPRTGLDLGLQAARSRPSVLDGLPYHIAHARIIQRVLDGGRLNKLGMRRCDQPYARLFGRGSAQRQGSQALRRSSKERSTADGSHLGTLPEYSSMIESELYG